MVPLGKQPGKQSLSEQIANLADLIPLANTMNLSKRVIKLGILHESGRNWLRQEVGLKEPMDQVILALIFIVACYIPSLVLSFVLSIFCKKEKKPVVDQSQFRFN